MGACREVNFPTEQGIVINPSERAARRPECQLATNWTG